MRDAVIVVEAVRAPLGGRNGVLSEFIWPASWPRVLADRAGVDPALIDDVIWGCASQAGEQTATSPAPLSGRHRHQGHPRRAVRILTAVGAFPRLRSQRAIRLHTVGVARRRRRRPEDLQPLRWGDRLGHARGGSGARLMTIFIHHMRNSGTHYGLQTMCEGGGQANATILEVL